MSSRRSDITAASSAESAGSGLSRGVDRRMAEARVKMLQEKMAAEKQKAARNKYREVTGREIGGEDVVGELEAEIRMAKLRQAELRSQIEREQRLAEKLADRPKHSSVGHVTRRPESPRDSRGDRFSGMMEMMVVQNSQMHSLILSQMLLRQSLGESSSVARQPAVSQPQMPIYIPMPMYPPQYPQQPPQQPQIVEYRSKPATPVPVAKPEEVKTVKKITAPFPFPGNESQQKLRRLLYAAFFIATLDRWTTENKFRPTNDFLFDLKLKEILETLHRIYKAPDGQLYNITMSTVMGPDAAELTDLLNVPKTLSIEDEREVTRELSYCVENTTFQITDIMPSSGILGTHRKSGVFEMMRTGNLYPRGYFYDMERRMLDFTEDGRTARISDADGRMLIVGMFLTRALVETLYLKTEHYGLVEETTPRAERNTKLVATILMYIYRRVVGKLSTIDRGTRMDEAPLPSAPPEMREMLYSDAEIVPVLKLIKKSLDYSEQLLMQWSEEYVKRLREAAF